VKGKKYLIFSNFVLRDFSFAPGTEPNYAQVLR